VLKRAGHRQAMIKAYEKYYKPWVARLVQDIYDEVTDEDALIGLDGVLPARGSKPATGRRRGMRLQEDGA